MRFFFCTTILFLSLSCKKDKLNAEYSILIGKWHWRNSIHQYGWCVGDNYDEELSPTTEGIGYSIEFYKNGKMAFFENDILKKRVRIVLFFTNINEFGEIHVVIDPNNDESQRIAIVGNDSLINVINYPFVTQIGCEEYRNYFVKE
jgi:hypothetical protein